MPTNLYGPGDNFDLGGGHVVPSLIRKAHEAKVARRPVRMKSGGLVHPVVNFCMWTTLPMLSCV
jgi:nucleoside-diphosphate-sugar epimerase